MPERRASSVYLFHAGSLSESQAYLDSLNKRRVRRLPMAHDMFVASDPCLAQAILLRDEAFTKESNRIF